jgi:hypothetical protein
MIERSVDMFGISVARSASDGSQPKHLHEINIRSSLLSFESGRPISADCVEKLGAAFKHEIKKRSRGHIIT